MLKNEWKDASFKIGAVSDKAAVGEDDDLVIIAAVDPQGEGLQGSEQGKSAPFFGSNISDFSAGVWTGLNAAKRVVAEASQRGPVILLNPRLARSCC